MNDTRKATIHGVGKPISPYVKDYLVNSGIDSTFVLCENQNATITLFGGMGFETPSQYLHYIQSRKLPEGADYKFIVHENNQFYIDESKLTKYLKLLNNPDNTAKDIVRLKNSLELQFHIQELEVLTTQKKFLESAVKSTSSLNQ